MGIHMLLSFVCANLKNRNALLLRSLTRQVFFYLAVNAFEVPSIPAREATSLNDC